MRVFNASSREFYRFLERRRVVKQRVQRRVQRILEDVRLHGDHAVVKYTRRFDHAKVTPARLRVTERELNGAFQDIKPDFVASLKVALANVTRFYRRNTKRSWRTAEEDGVILGERVTPIESVGIYIPAGTAPLISTVYMTVLPARLAGVEKIIMATPPNAAGEIDPHLLVVASLLKVDQVYRMGGAQAIGALAFGTKTIPKVDKIVGPGNVYVTEAKRQVYGYVALDMVAGPSEVVIIGNQFSNAAFIAVDLAAQEEHAGGMGIVVTPSSSLAKALKACGARGALVRVKNLGEAVEVANRIAPEHLQIMVKRPQKLLRKVRHAGAVLIGPYTPTTVSDYLAGPSHVFPTCGTSRYFSGLGTDDFVKTTRLIQYSKKALEKVREPLECLASLEGLTSHVESVKVRFASPADDEGAS